MNILIVGMGREGRSLKDYLAQRHADWNVATWDRNDGVSCPDLKEFDRIFKSPGVPWNEDLRAVEERVSSATQLFFDELDASNRVIAVTGSKGKSTVSTLIFKSLEAAGVDALLLGNIGRPMLDFADVQGKTLVLELSSFQLEALRFKPHIAVVTSLFPEHLDRHGGEAGYYEAKRWITKGQGVEDFLVHHADENVAVAWATQAKRVHPQDFWSDLSEVISTDSVRIPGAHNRKNILLVLTVMKLLGVPFSAVETALHEFKGLPHRLQFVCTVKGVDYIDDAIATNPPATIAALNVYGERVGCLFLGGEDPGWSYDDLIRRCVELKVANVVLFPDSGARIRDAWVRLGLAQPQFFETRSMEDAVKFAASVCEPGQVALLSCAAKSFSVWKNYEEKGDLFVQAVQKL